MQFESLTQFFYMGGHGLYVWLSFALTFIVLALNVLQPWLDKKSILVTHLKRMQRESIKK